MAHIKRLFDAEMPVRLGLITKLIAAELRLAVHLQPQKPPLSFLFDGQRQAIIKNTVAEHFVIQRIDQVEPDLVLIFSR